MRIESTNPFHIARAYQVQPPRAAQPVAPAAPVTPSADPIAGSIKPDPTTRIVAATVPGRISFASAEPSHDSAAIPFYRHPADKNAAATALTAGRTLDVQG